MVAQCSGQATQTSVSVIAAVKTRSSVTLFPPTPRVVIATFMTSWRHDDRKTRLCEIDRCCPQRWCLQGYCSKLWPFRWLDGFGKYCNRSSAYKTQSCLH